MQQYQDLLIDALLDQGFTVEEAERLITLQDRVEQTMREHQRREDALRREFARWLIIHQKLSEFPGM